MSKYAESMGDNSWSGGAAIIPLSYESDVPLSVRVPTSTRALLDRLAAKTGRAKGDLLTEAISLLRDNL